jgi:hypothetical protein
MTSFIAASDFIAFVLYAVILIATVGNSLIGLLGGSFFVVSFAS